MGIAYFIFLQCASVYSTRLLPKPSPKTKNTFCSCKRVSFAAGTKNHDGQSPASLLLQDLIVYGMQNTLSEQALVRFLTKMPKRAHLFPSLMPRLRQLVVQLASGSCSYVYVVPVSNALAIPVSCLGQLAALYQLCVNTCRRVAQVFLKRLQNSPANNVKYAPDCEKMINNHAQIDNCFECVDAQVESKHMTAI